MLENFILCATVFRRVDGKLVKLNGESTSGTIKVQWIADGRLWEGNAGVSLEKGEGCTQGGSFYIATETKDFNLKSLKIDVDGETGPGEMTFHETLNKGTTFYADAEFVIGDEENTYDPGGVQKYALKSLFGAKGSKSAAGATVEKSLKTYGSPVAGVSFEAYPAAVKGASSAR